MDTFLFSISTGTANGVVNVPALFQQIKNDTILTAGARNALTYVAENPKDTDPDELEVAFSVTLSGADSTRLTAIVAAHQGEAFTDDSLDIFLSGQQDTDMSGTEFALTFLTLDNLSVGRWRIEFFCEVFSTATNRVQVTLDLSVGGEISFDARDTDGNWQSIGMMRVITVTPGEDVTVTANLSGPDASVVSARRIYLCAVKDESAVAP